MLVSGQFHSILMPLFFRTASDIVLPKFNAGSLLHGGMPVYASELSFTPADRYVVLEKALLP